MLNTIQHNHIAEDTSNMARQMVKAKFTATIVVPCYNEEARLQADVFLSYLEQNPQTRLLFVNDGSKDNTIAKLYCMKAQNAKQVEVLDLAQNGGKAEAVRQGLLQAIELGSDYVGYWDADLATPLYAIEDFIRVAKRLPEIDVIYGSRRQLLGHKIKRKLSRRIVSRSCATLARIAINQPISDTQCGAKLFRNGEELRVALSRKFTAGWLFDVELFARLAGKMEDVRGKFYEYPLLEWTEIPGSKIDTKAIVKSGFVMLKLIGAMRLGNGQFAQV